jgi:hypothetical protein
MGIPPAASVAINKTADIAAFTSGSRLCAELVGALSRGQMLCRPPASPQPCWQSTPWLP